MGARSSSTPFSPASASSKAGADRVVADIKAKGGKAIAVHGDAGVYYSFLPLEVVTEEDFHRHFNVNVLGLRPATKEAAKLFGDEGGSVINIGSVASDLNSPNSVVYTATKGAVGPSFGRSGALDRT